MGAIPAERPIPDTARAAITRYLSAVDGAAPGLVAGLFATGSLALDDYQHGSSDLDFVALTSRRLETPDIEHLRAVHATLGTPHLDGIYLDRTSFEAMPDDGGVVTHAHEGRVHTERPCADLNPVLWRTLESHPLTLREPAAAARMRTVDEARLRAWCLDNLRTYWLPLATRLRSAVATRTDDALIDTSTIVWTALGPGRLHFTITTGNMIAKTAARAYTARHFSQFASLLERAVTARSGADARFTVRDARRAAELVEAIVQSIRI